MNFRSFVKIGQSEPVQPMFLSPWRGWTFLFVKVPSSLTLPWNPQEDEPRTDGRERVSDISFSNPRPHTPRRVQTSVVRGLGPFSTEKFGPTDGERRTGDRKSGDGTPLGQSRVIMLRVLSRRRKKKDLR